ncbi:hypothetical protein, partial [Enterovirga sp.]|uniref:hypothetical protein n=1 Tax=Enterovirga sp. TaxID=2026350 RepID=UPI002C4CC5A6
MFTLDDYANVRQPPLSTLNLAHMIPLTGTSPYIVFPRCDNAAPWITQRAPAANRSLTLRPHDQNLRLNGSAPPHDHSLARSPMRLAATVSRETVR